MGAATQQTVHTTISRWTQPRRLQSAVAGRLLAAAVLVAAAGGQATAAETVLVAAGTSMTYRANASNPGIGITWTAEAFTPSGWSAGSYGVGYETSPPGATSLVPTTVASTSASVYTRATFSIADVSMVNNLFLGADYDDGYIAWINGVEVFRSTQMPAGTPAWNTPAALHESSNAASPNYGTLQNITAAALSALHNGTNVLAVGVWNATLPSSDLVLVPRLSMNVDASVSRGPYLQLGTPDSVTVRWRTTLSTDSCVRYGPSPGGLTESACLGASTTEHIVNVTGLDPDTTYFYSVGTSASALAGNTADHYFTTSPEIGTAKPTRVWVLGDSGTADTNAQDVRDAYLAFTGSTTTDLWLMLGDNAYSTGTDTQFQNAVFNMYPTMLRNSVLWPTLGNHDGMSADSATQTGPYYNNFTLPTAAQAGGVPSGTEAYYSFDYGDIHFICLDSYETSRSAAGAMMTWLEADLADTTAEWIVAFFHHPPYSRGSHDSDVDIEMVDMREVAVPLLEEGGVDLVLTGHSHSYERSFLIDGHYEDSPTFTAAMQEDGGSGRIDDTGAYEKPGGGPAPREGAVYVVAGSSGQVSAAPLDHPAMYISFAELGSLVLDFDGNQLDVQFIDENAVVQDYFTILKTPPPSVCGNGVPEAGEQCDDGNASNTDACLGTCVTATCGDGFVRAGFEQCDDGNPDNGDGCSTSCILASCGDGVVQVGVEECDDGNADNTDDCLDVCQDASCGDSFVHAGVEECDDADADNTDACLDTCQAASCGDGHVQAGIEECEDGNADSTDACTNLCTNAVCGDGFVRAGVEECDDGNASSGDGCSPGCLTDCATLPRLDCRSAGVSILKVVYGSNPDRNSVKWKWRRGAAVTVAELGDPTVDADYNLCFYPNSPGAGTLGAQTILPAGAPWESRDEKGYAYRDSLASNGGVRDLKIVTAAAGRSQVALKALGASLPSGLLPATSYTVQLVGADMGGCWTSSFATGVATTTSFKGKTKIP